MGPRIPKHGQASISQAHIELAWQLCCGTAVLNIWNQKNQQQEIYK